jgi:hypothetical protein
MSPEISRLGHPHARHQHGRVQPGELPQRLDLAARQAICAAGLMRYGYVEEAHRVIAARSTSQRRSAADSSAPSPASPGASASPASYPTSCAPQAWASASPLLWLRTLLRIDPWATHQELRIDPALPTWIHALRVEDIKVAGESITVDVENSRVDLRGSGHLDVLRSSRSAANADQVPGDF